jgi:hypothetical protein
MNQWWSDAVFYQVYPRSFADSDGDGVGDLGGVTARLDHLEQLGVDAIWLNPVTVSPMADHGYDVADPRDVDPLFGGLAALDLLIERAHARGIKVTMDLVPNHTSSAHSWFQAALESAPGSPERQRYIFREGAGPDGAVPPNNWLSVFGGPAWSRVIEADGSPGQWYLHLFDAEQPDLNWDNPEVFEDLATTLRFWLDRGVDGFRIDVAHGMAKPPNLPDMELDLITGLLADTNDDPRFNHVGVHDIHRDIRAVLDDYPHAVSIGEIWVFDNAEFAKYLRPDELHMGFNFRLVRAPFDAPAIHDAITNALAAAALAGREPHLDAVESRCRPGGDPLRRRPPGPGPRAGDGHGDAGAARRGVPLQRRGAGPAQRRPARRGAAGPGVGTLRPNRTRSRRLPGAAALGGVQPAVRVLHEPTDLAAHPGGLVDADRATTAGRPRLDTELLPRGDNPAAQHIPVRQQRRRVGSPRPAPAGLPVRRGAVRPQHRPDIGAPGRRATAGQ